VCHTYQQDNPGAVITKYSFTPLFAKVWSQSFTPNNLISGFKKCGIYPFNSEAIEILDDVAPAPQDVEQHDISMSHQQQSVSQGSQIDASSDKQDAEQITDEMIAKFIQ